MFLETPDLLPLIHTVPVVLPGLKGERCCGTLEGELGDMPHAIWPSSGSQDEFVSYADKTPSLHVVAGISAIGYLPYLILKC